MLPVLFLGGLVPVGSEFPSTPDIGSDVATSFLQPCLAHKSGVRRCERDL